MRLKSLLHLLALGAALLSPVDDARADDILITSNSVWRYLDNGTDQGAAWRMAWDENDPVWSSGAAPLGFGLSGITTTQAMAHVTYYHRRVFTVADPAAYSKLIVRLRRDDGGIVYLNGMEVFRSNMPTGAVDYLTLATISTTGPNQFNFFSNNVSPSLLVAGTNRLAVEIHQAGTNSVDAAFNLELRGQLGSTSPPIITEQPQSLTVTQGQTATFAVTAFNEPARRVLTGVTRQGPPAAPGQFQPAAEGDPVPGLDVKLGKPPGGQLIAQTTSGANGSFEFSGIPAGSYLLTATSTGAVPACVTLAAADPTSVQITGSGLLCNPVPIVAQPESNPPSYQWWRDGQPVSGVLDKLIITNVQPADNGAVFRVVISNSFGSVTSAVATLTVLPDNIPPALLSASADCVSNKVTLTFSEWLDVASATEQFNYTLSGGINILNVVLAADGRTVCLFVDTLPPGITNTVTVDGVADLAGNTIVSGSNGSFACGSPPVITSQPTDQVAILNHPVTFVVAATGTTPMTFQWRNEGNVVFGNSTSSGNGGGSSLVISNAQFADAGHYDVVVSNAFGSVTSAVATLVVSPPPCLTAWWPMEGSVTDIVGANQPSATAGISFVPGKIGQGALVGVGGYMEIPDVAALRNPLFTLEAWVRPDGIGPNDDTVGSSIIQKVRDGGFSYSMYWRKDGKFTFLTGSTATDFIVSTHNFPSGCFYHVVGIYDGAEFRLYINGVLEAQRASSAPLDYSGGNPWTIGASPEPFRTLGYARTWNGVIDEVKIWCRALSAPEILAAYVAGGPDVRCGCVEPPMITCLPDFGVLCGTPWNFNTPTAHDVCCDTNATVTILKTETNGTCPMFITRTWVATDCHGNTNTCSQTVAVIDNTPPIFGSATPSPNLVPNPGFENHTACPSTFNSEIVFAPPWIAPTAGSSDYYHTCGTYPVSVPVNRAGNQTPYDGDAYAGLHAHNTDLSPQLTPYREYIETPLSQPLQPGRTYSVSFYVSLSDTATRAVDNLGAHLSVNQVTSGTHGPLLLTPQVRNPAGNFLTDKIGWTLIQGTFTAAGGEQFLTIGNFYSEAQTSTQPVSGGTDGWAYYYIDGVTVRDTTPTCLTNKTVECGSAWAFDEPAAYDECCGSAATITVLKTESSGFCPRYFTRTWQATDCCSNTATCIQVVTVVDTTPPFFACDLPQVNLVQNGSFEAGVPTFNLANQLHQLSVGAPDVSGWTIVETGAAFYWANGAHAASAGTAFGPASDGNLYLYFNGSYDNTSLRGKIATSINFPSSGTYRLEYDLWSEPSINGSRDAGFTVELTGPASYSYTDLFTPPFSLNGTPPAVTAANWQHVIHDFAVTTPGTYALSFTDASVYGNPSLPNAGNTPSPLLDNVSITAKCCDTTRIVECGTPWQFERPTAFDTCCDTNVTITSYGFGSGNACSNVETVIWTATDCCGNSVTCTQRVIIVDTTAPVVTCPANKTEECGTAWVFDAPTAYDTCCGTNVTIIVLNTVTNGACPMSVTRTWMITDCCSNSVTCSQTVTVVDTTPPVFGGPCTTNRFEAGNTTDDFNGAEPASPSAGLARRLEAEGIHAGKQFDDCTTDRFFAHTFPNLPKCITAAKLTVRLKPCGADCENDTINLSVTDAAGILRGSWSRDLNDVPGDWCDYTAGLVLSLDLSALPVVGGGTVNGLPFLNTYGFLDFICQDDTAVDYLVLEVTSCCPSTNKTVACGSTWTFDEPSVSDGCCGTNVTISVSTVSDGLCPESITRTWTATDCCSNSATHSQTVTVGDPGPLVITCPADITLSIVGSSTAVSYPAPNVTGGALMACTPPSGSTFSLGTTLVTCTATNACCTKTCTFNVTVRRFVTPVIVQQPLSQSVASNGSVTLSVAVTNTATLPIGYLWRRNGATTNVQVLNSTASFLTLTNVRANASYSVIITNAASPGGIGSAAAAITVMADADGDHMMDIWELAHGFSPTNASDALLDSDGDGVSNLAEHLAGTNPTNAASYFRLGSSGMDGLTFTLQFGAVSNLTYTVESKDSLGVSPWSKVADIVGRTTNRVETIVDPIPGTNRFYRVVTPRQP